MELGIDWTKTIPRFLEDHNRFKEPPDYYITFPDLAAGTAITGGGYIYIGEAIHQWMDGTLTQPCPECGRTACVHHAASMQSGTGYWIGACPVCGIITSRTQVLKTALKATLHGKWTRQLGYKPLLREASPYHYTIKDGLTRTGDTEEIRMNVPGWLEFMREHYPDCLMERG